MKKRMVLSAVILSICACIPCMSVSAGEMESSKGFSEKMVEVLREGEDAGELALRFYDAAPNVAYMGIDEYSQFMYLRPLTLKEEEYAAHPDDVAMVAVHSKLVTMDPTAFLADKDFTMPFATDTDDSVKNIVGGTGTLPQTIVLNRKGEVVYNQVGSVTPEMLSALYDEADR